MVPRRRMGSGLHRAGFLKGEIMDLFQKFLDMKGYSSTDFEMPSELKNILEECLESVYNKGHRDGYRTGYPEGYRDGFRIK